ncbi:MAG: TetR/AcrR family transcriptional regulator [Bacilli bacterium]
MHIQSHTNSQIMEASVFYPKAKRGKVTFRRLIDAATKVFYERGYANSTIADIAQEAGVAVGTIYIYFKDKYTIYFQVLKDFQNQIREHLNNHIKEAHTRREKERAGIRAWLEFVLEHRRAYEMIWESLYIDRRLFDDYYLSFAEAYRKGLEHDCKELVNVDLHTIAYMLMGIANFVGIQVMLTDDINDQKIDEIVDSVMLVLAGGLFKK